MKACLAVAVALVILVPSGGLAQTAARDRDTAADVDLYVDQQPPQPQAVQPPQGGPQRGQPSQPGPPPAPAPPPTPPRDEGQPFNVRVEVTISEQTGNSPAVKKTVTVVTGEGRQGFVRSAATFSGPPSPLNIDVDPSVLPNGKIRLGLGVQYDLPAPPNVVLDASGRPVESQTATRSALGSLTRTEIRQNLRVVLENGKPLMVSQSADPVGDRKVTVEVTATILK